MDNFHKSSDGCEGCGCILIFLIALILFTRCRSESWEGFVYPDRDDLTVYRAIGTFGSLAECRVAAVAELRTIDAAGRGDYECGLNCRESTVVGGPRVCDTTER